MVGNWVNSSTGCTINYSTTASTSSSSDWFDCKPATTSFKSVNTLWTVKIGDLVDDVPMKLSAAKREIELPDGAKLLIDDLGNYRIEDASAKVTYKANRMREFSPHLNASDMVAKFVEYVGAIGIRRGEVMNLPLQLFIAWLVMEAAERDGDAIPEGVVRVDSDPLLKAMRNPRCLRCGRFIPRIAYQHRFPFCSPEHGQMYVERKVPQLLITNQHCQPSITA